MMPPIKFTAMAVGRENKIPLATYKIPLYITMLTLFKAKSIRMIQIAKTGFSGVKFTMLSTVISSL